jgi:hypothetical protein
VNKGHAPNNINPFDGLSYWRNHCLFKVLAKRTEVAIFQAHRDSVTFAVIWLLLGERMRRKEVEGEVGKENNILPLPSQFSRLHGVTKS